MEIVSNASPLIFLAKIERMDLLNGYEVTIPKQVYEEINKGIESKDDAQKIKTLVERSIIKVEEIEIIKELEQHNLGKGEKAAISLAINKKVGLVLLDERKARRTAKFHNLKPIGTICILIEAWKNNKLNKKELKELIKKLIGKGYRINEALIISLLNEIE